MANEIYFCPRCHRRIEPPAFLKQANLKIQGAINLACGYCKNGKIVIKPPAAAAPADVGATGRSPSDDPDPERQDDERLQA